MAGLAAAEFGDLDTRSAVVAIDVALLTPAGGTLRSMSQHLTVTSSPALPTDDGHALRVLP